MKITYELFKRSCPASTMPDDSIFVSISQEIERSVLNAKMILTPEIFDMLDSVEPSDERYDDIRELRNDTVVYICASAFYSAIPQLDLVLTNGGFGVVNNQNVAPASADRVEKLRVALRRCFLARLDDMLSKLRFFEAWHGSCSQRQFCGTLFWNSSHVKPITGALSTRDDLDSKYGEILSAELKVAQLISPEELVNLRNLEATGSTNSIQDMAIGFCRAYVIALICDHQSIELHRRTLLGFIENHPAEFSLYFSSQTYKANHFEPYHNEKDDPCFFFG